MSQHRRVTAAAAIIGNEILSGKVVDSNTPYLIGALRKVGVSLNRIHVLPDEVDVIVESVKALADSFDLVITSGGVGPTHDDVTMEAIAKAFGVELAPHPLITSALESRFPDGVNDALMRIATVPKTAQLLWANDQLWPIVYVENVHILPGIPRLFEACADHICAQMEPRPFHCHNVYVKLSESDLVPTLETVLKQYPEVEIGSYPRYDSAEYRVRLTLECDDQTILDSATTGLIELLPSDAVHEVVK